MAAELSFAYSGRDDDDKVVRGRMDAGSERAALQQLRTMGLSPISIVPARPIRGLNMDLHLPGYTKPVALADLAVMSRQMATMTAAGLSLLRTLIILSEQTQNRRLAQVISVIRSDVETGMSLSHAFDKHDEVFPPIMINLVRAGEIGGFLEDSLGSIADNFETEVRLRDTIKSALAYPVIVMIMAVLAIIGMLIFIVPVFEDMFQQLGGQLPIATQVLVHLSNIMLWVAPILIVGAVLAWLWWGKNRHTERVRRVADPLKLKLPVVGPVLAKLAIARFSRNFATMIGAGVPILGSLKIVGETSGNWVIEEALHKVQESVSRGRSIAGPLALEPVFPAMVTQMIAVGEDAGALGQMLRKIAEFYDQEVQSTTQQLTALIEPLMIAVIGIIVGGMVVALYLPMFNVFDYVG
ncbi:type II secretion system F family protein [Cryobacterium levicorallinum]|uniref:Type IV pilus assembly protein PilC n=2 Tax=Cryobacterium levicorallinum TaxID=995038 RepID=A0ABY1EID1_9MICO|nr:type II secretion system F family protein [Cryobacterium levicorallinum]GEP28713.1 type II secretion system protein F [Cryobacterium levicorallinum]SFH97325.1 type IV pilus assembly protein PilC [Cryobacterium levicorallinum]